MSFRPIAVRKRQRSLRVFVAGASGVIGVRLVPQLVLAGHEVAGMTRSPAKVELLRGLGAEPVVCDAFDAHALRDAVGVFQPEAVVNELTDLPDQQSATTTRTRACGVRARATCLPLRRRRERRASSRRALPGSYGRRWCGRQRTRTARARGRRSRSPVRAPVRPRHLLRRRQARATARSCRRGRPPHRAGT